MFAKLATVALLVAPLASALTLHTPTTSPTSAGEITISWDTADGDPELFTIELIHPDFNQAFAIATNVDPREGSRTLTLPVVPAQGGYTLEAVNIGNINDVYSSTSAFSIAPNPSSSFSPVSSASRPVASSPSGSAGASVTRSNSSPSGSAAPSGSQSQGASASSSQPPVVSDLAGQDGGASTSVVSRVAFLGVAVAGAALAL